MSTCILGRPLVYGENNQRVIQFYREQGNEGSSLIKISKSRITEQQRHPEYCTGIPAHQLRRIWENRRRYVFIGRTVQGEIDWNRPRWGIYTVLGRARKAISACSVTRIGTGCLDWGEWQQRPQLSSMSGVVAVFSLQRKSFWVREKDWRGQSGKSASLSSNRV